MLKRYWPALLIGAAWLWLFWPMITGQKVVGFRDSAYLYYPLFKWIDAQWAAGEIPLWNPYCNFGMPVVADGTSSVFYPGKLVFFCRFLSYPARYGIYLAIHIPIAAAGAFWFARALRANRAGATLAAFSFAFGGSVLFQVTNVIYLVSAAWLPFALCCVWKMVKTGELKWAVGAGVCCALMILGGDPQMVYHVGLISVATIVGEFLRRWRRRSRTNSSAKSRPYRWLVSSGLKLGLMVMVTSLLAAIQLLPTYQWAQRSERTNPESPANIYMAMAGSSNWVEAKAALLGPPVGTADHAYQFSQPPWSVMELFWPNVSGKPFPTNQRWTSALPGADRVWVPSIYAGLLVVLIGMVGMRLWGRRRKQVWLTRVLLFFAIASFGWYGAVWLFNEIASTGDQNSFGPQVGGIYWAMNMLLPKYFAFRYPAKLFLIASLALSLLAGLNLREVRLKGTRFIAAAMFLLTGVGLIGLNAYFQLQLLDMPHDRMFGPFDSGGSIAGLYTSLGQALVIALGIGALTWIRFSNRFASDTKAKWVATRSSTQWVPVCLVLLTAIDVLFANAWLVASVKSDAFESPTVVQNRLNEIKSAAPDAAPIRVFRSRYQALEPIGWATQSSRERLTEIVKWQRESLYPKHHFEHEVILIGSFSSIWPTIYEQYLESWESWAMQPDSKKPFHGIVRRADGDLVDVVPSEPTVAFDPPSRIVWLGELPSKDNANRDPAELSQPVTTRQVTEFGSNRFVARVSTAKPRTLGFSRIADPGWKATVRNLSTDEVKQVPLEVEPGCEMMFLPFEQAGEFEVEFKYSPIEFWIGAWISGCAWVVVLGCCVASISRKISQRI